MRTWNFFVKMSCPASSTPAFALISSVSVGCKGYTHSKEARSSTLVCLESWEPLAAYSTQRLSLDRDL